MQIKPVYENKVFKPLEDPGLPDKSEVRITIKKSFSDLLDELGELETKKDIDSSISEIRTRNYDK